MILSDLRNMFRLQVPQATTAGIKDAMVNTLLSRAQNKVNLITKLLVGSKIISVPADSSTINISDYISDYLGMDEGGIWYLDSNSVYQRLIPKTKKWFDDRIENWRDNSSGTPQYYYVEGNEVGFDKPFSSATNCRVYYIVKLPDISDDSNYPWTNTSSEITAFEPLDDALIAYAKWKVQPALGKDEQGRYVGGSSYAEFIAETTKAGNQVRKRPDFVKYKSTRMVFA